MIYIIDDDEQTANVLAEFIQLMGLQTKLYIQARHFFGDKKLNNINAILILDLIMLGHELNMHVVAEGVEDLETLTLLKEMGCDIAQGFYIAKPMPAKQLLTWITNQ